VNPPFGHALSGQWGDFISHASRTRFLTLAHCYIFFSMGLGFILKAQCSFIST